MQDEVRSDETRATSDQNRIFHIVEVALIQPHGTAGRPLPANEHPIVNKKDGIHPVL